MTQPNIENLNERFGDRYRWFATLTVMVATIATVLNATIINVAIPDIMGAFGIGQDKAQWLSTAFLAAMTSFMLLNTWAVDNFGVRNTYMVAMLVFAFGSVLGGISPNENMLIFARTLQGASAGIIQPLAMLTMFQVFPPAQRGQAMGIYGIGIILAPAVGPVVGGLMVDSLSWRYVFFLSLPFCAASIVLANLFMPGRIEQQSTRRLDWPGFALLVMFLISVLTALSNGAQLGWHSNKLVLMFGIAAFSLPVFIWWETKCEHPILNMKLFQNSQYSAAAAVSFVFGAGLFGTTYLIPLFVQTIQGYTPTKSGLLLMPGGLMLGVIFPLAGRLSDSFRPSGPIILGIILFVGSTLLMTGVALGTSFWAFALWILLGRIGLGLVMPSLNVGALRVLSPALLSQGSGTINFMRQLGGAFGVNLLAITLERRTSFHLEAFMATQTAANHATSSFLNQLHNLLASSGLPLVEQSQIASYYLARTIYIQSSILGYQDSFILVLLIFLVALFPAWWMGKQLE